MFKEALQEIVQRTDGGVAGLLMGLDGIAIESFVTGDEGISIEEVGIEFGSVVQKIGQASESLEAGNTQEVTIQAERLTTLIRMLGNEYFVAITLEPGGNLGKARFLMRTMGPKILAELA